MSLFSFLSGSVAERVVAPTAIIVSDPVFGVVGSVVKLDGMRSFDDFDRPLSYKWSFESVPIGSMVRSEGFRSLTTDKALVSFSPDVVGEYVLGLIVNNGEGDSQKVTSRVSIRAILVPHGRGIIPDGKFIWSYIRDVWTQVENREWFETFWSALIQIVGSEMLKLYQNDFNKSIRDIQELYQRRWMKYEPRLDIETGCTFILGNHLAGDDAFTDGVGRVGQGILVAANEIILTSGSVLPNAAGQEFSIIYDSRCPANVGTYLVSGLNKTKSGYTLIPVKDGSLPDPAPGKILSTRVTFGFRSQEWTLESTLNVAVGDMIPIRSGTNAGCYRITSLVGSVATVNKIPPNQATNLSVDLYRPVGFEVQLRSAVTTDTFAVSKRSGVQDLSPLVEGRVAVVDGQACTILRVTSDPGHLIPLSIVTTSSGQILAGMRELPWRTPHTLISPTQNFEEAGVSTGDTLVVDVVDTTSNLTFQVNLQVVGVDGNRLGFVFTDEEVQDGVIPEVSESIATVVNANLGVTIAQLESLFATGLFKSEYCNQELGTSTVFKGLGLSVSVRPRFIIRNSLIQVDDTLRSIPALQDWIVQPVLSKHDGKVFQVKNEVEYELKSEPISLIENLDFLIDGDVAFSGEMTFKTGTDVLEADDAHFVDRGIDIGDTFTVLDPVTLVGDYKVLAVLSPNKVLLSKPIPLYVLSEYVTAKVELRRRKTGRFIRFVKGSFSAKKPAPERLWSEVSFYDNNETIENNFGILVGLTRKQLDDVSSDLNYRQSVAGLMYAYTRGSSLDRVRLGAQILLGLPFAESRGIIRSVENDYRLDPYGNPAVGRLLVEDIDSTGKPLGIQRIYTFPVDVTSLSGLETNPATGKTYAVGDTVELFAAICKGVEVKDYLIEPLSDLSSGNAKLRQFHTVRVNANNSIFTYHELAMVSDFLKKITPSYVAFVISGKTELSDQINILDRVSMQLSTPDGVLVDNAYFSLPTALTFDAKNLGVKPGFWDDGIFWVRKVGEDLVTEDGSATATLAAGGFITPAFGEGPVVREQDILWIREGPNQGFYGIEDLTDTTVTIIDAPTMVAGTQSFAILRPVTALIRQGSTTLTSGTVLTLTPGLTADGVSPGDWLSLWTLTAQERRTVVRVGPAEAGSAHINISHNPPDMEDIAFPALLAGQVQVDSAPSIVGLADYRVYRPAFIENPLSGSVLMTPDLVNPHVVSFSDTHVKAILENGDELRDSQAPYKRYIVLDAAIPYITPAPSGAIRVQVCKKGHPSAPIGLDHADLFGPQDPASVGLVETNTSAAVCVAGSPNVHLQMAVGSGSLVPVTPADLLARPGDLLALLNGANSLVDVGHGAGVYPVADTSSDHLVLTVNLSSSDPSAWRLVRRR